MLIEIQMKQKQDQNHNIVRILENYKEINIRTVLKQRHLQGDQDHLNEQQEYQYKDMILTRIDQDNKSQVKIRRKGFMKLKDIQQENHKKSIVELTQMEIEDIQTESQCNNIKHEYVNYYQQFYQNILNFLKQNQYQIYMAS
ncbi:unnamed protein product [Paramecium sonneborni]|uniref:Uncharacterized protein n=1 Tax=Paramecium sonneborni TaxID=65129 RepID=A0A8S1MS65_9CILI|nr:unnamed protein product [Paramecium sonneborni]